ncbi:phytoene desaturase family protein [Meiothermus hypogaeus]|uniref:Hydroxyneurosporene desaturase n=1 Tax=Meiothermus hypogaeus TaxID=884155 RepID=A0ABX9MKS8_9DEIN|nr:FAD-dependent oxidoreductase [Meiothermus hypogaeus]RIH75343.1 Hydroxyneurosporene desaturase [Meiothermus hypogaeus]
MRTIVVGAGFAGLAAALRLRQAGLEVSVIEQFDQPGGKAIGWEGVPTGPTVLTLPEIPRQILGAFGRDLPGLKPVSPLTRYAWPDGRVFAPELELGATLAQLSAQEARDYRRLLGEARTMYEGARETFIFGPPPQTFRLLQYGLREGVKAHPLQPLSALVQSGPYLTPFFLRFATYLGANPYRAPAVLHNIAWVELGLGVFHLPGGMRALAQQLYELARAQGVKFLFGQKVLRLQRLPGRVGALQTDQGWHSADLYVSAADRHFTLAWLGLPLPQEALGVSGFAVLMKLAEAVPLGHYIYFSPDYRAEWREIAAGRWPQDPTLYLHTDGDTAFLLVNAPALPPGASSPSESQAYAQHLLRKLERHPLPIAAWRALSPLDYSQTAYRGALYGRAPHGLLGALRPGWEVAGLRNLAQVGGTVHPGGGVPLSMLSGWNGAGWLLSRFLGQRGGAL